MIMRRRECGRGRKRARRRSRSRSQPSRPLAPHPKKYKLEKRTRPNWEGDSPVHCCQSENLPFRFVPGSGAPRGDKNSPLVFRPHPLRTGGRQNSPLVFRPYPPLRTGGRQNSPLVFRPYPPSGLGVARTAQRSDQAGNPAKWQVFRLKPGD